MYVLPPISKFIVGASLCPASAICVSLGLSSIKKSSIGYLLSFSSSVTLCDANDAILDSGGVLELASFTVIASLLGLT